MNRTNTTEIVFTINRDLYEACKELLDAVSRPPPATEAEAREKTMIDTIMLLAELTMTSNAMREIIAIWEAMTANITRDYGSDAMLDRVDVRADGKLLCIGRTRENTWEITPN
jgi:hypothetical protein